MSEFARAPDQSVAFTRYRRSELVGATQWEPDAPPVRRSTWSTNSSSNTFGDFTRSASTAVSPGVWTEPVSEQQRVKEAFDKSRLLLEIHDRIAELKKLAVEEQLPWNGRSEWDFWSFFRRLANPTKPRLVLTDDGNVRAVWKNEKREQVAFEFWGGDRLNFVIFVLPPDAAAMERSVGSLSSLRRAKEKLEGEHLMRLLIG